MAGDGSNLDCIFSGCRTQSCGTLELARQLVDFIVVGSQQDQRVMWIGARFADATFGRRLVFEGADSSIALVSTDCVRFQTASWRSRGTWLMSAFESGTEGRYSPEHYRF